ncbi:hypothetical protein [Priestia flexa]|uniref:hypothetical protein n=1 Tax=Priestia flexa TaxID=86664 RepID=UPI0024914B25|nr:hypothetical protein [Priestia flexa]
MIAERKRMVVAGQTAIDIVEEIVNKQYTEKQLQLFKNIAEKRANRNNRNMQRKERALDVYQSR